MSLNPDNEILPVLGSREALFSFIQTVLNPASDGPKPVVISPNPFYQIYEARLSWAAAKSILPTVRHPSFNPRLEQPARKTYGSAPSLIVCSPNNPSGSVLQLEDWKKFLICKTNTASLLPLTNAIPKSILTTTKPIGGLQAAAQLGRGTRNIIMFTSLSKRSNVPGLRSGFVAGDAELLKNFLLYRTYHGSAMSIPVQRASIAAWNDEEHVIDNRRLYQEKFDRVIPILQQAFDVKLPDASFYIWLKVPDGDDLAFTRNLWQKAAIQVLPGRFLARDTEQGNPGEGYVRIALVADVESCVKAAETMVALYRR